MTTTTRYEVLYKQLLNNPPPIRPRKALEFIDPKTNKPLILEEKIGLDFEIFRNVNNKLKPSKYTFVENLVYNFKIEKQYKDWIEKSIEDLNDRILPNEVLKCIYYNAIYYFLQKYRSFSKIYLEMKKETEYVLIDGMNLINDIEFQKNNGITSEFKTFEEKIKILRQKVSDYANKNKTKTVILFHQDNSTAETGIFNEDNLFICSTSCYLSKNSEFCKDVVKNETDDLLLCLCYLITPSRSICITKDNYNFLKFGTIAKRSFEYIKTESFRV